MDNELDGLLDLSDLIDESEEINFALFENDFELPVAIETVQQPQQQQQQQQIQIQPVQIGQQQSIQVGQKRTIEQMDMPSTNLKITNLIDVTSKQNKQWPKLLGEIPIQFIKINNVQMSSISSSSGGEIEEEIKYKLFIQQGL